MKDKLLEQIKKLYNITELQPEEIISISDSYDTLDGKTKAIYKAALEVYTNHYVANRSTVLSALEQKTRIQLVTPSTLTALNSVIKRVRQYNINAKIVPLLRKVQLDVIEEERKLIRKTIIKGRNKHQEQTPGFISLLNSKIKLDRIHNEVKTEQDLEQIERTLTNSKEAHAQGLITDDDLQDIIRTEARRKSYVFAKRALREERTKKEEIENRLNRTNVSPTEQRQDERWQEAYDRVQLAEQEVISSQTWLLLSEGRISNQDAITQIGQAENRKHQIIAQRNESRKVYTRK